MGTCETWCPPHSIITRTRDKTAPGVSAPEAEGTDLPTGDPRDRVAHTDLPLGGRCPGRLTALPAEAGTPTQVGHRRRLGRGDRQYLIHRLTAAVTRREANSSRPAISREREIVTAVNEAFPLVIDAMEDENFDMEMVCNRLDVLDCAAAILSEILISAREEYQGLVAAIAEEEHRERAEVPA